MASNWIEAIDARSAGALASGALQPVQAEQTEMEDGGMRFIVRWVSSLAVKDAAKTAQVAIPGGPRDPNFNPFLNPDPELTVGPLGDAHTVILNKFPLSERHLVLARREFEEQLLPLARSDFAALAEIMAEAGGIGLYNGGTAAGASQRHKHVQWIPLTAGNASLRIFTPGLPAGLPEQGVAQHPALPMKHCFVRVCCGEGVPVATAADSLYAAYRLACETLDLQPGEDGLLSPYNLLASDGWLLVLPRSAEHFEGISMSAVCFGGTLYTRQPEQIESIRRVGPLKALAAVGY
ncbi:ATP adenylyltransferase family protein [Thauera sp.]|uniref:ATP adenylyltransferase family protein n=1 Tax=Thauera sp. TaxID=1905334 RepID=UPI0039E6444D